MGLIVQTRWYGSYCYKIHQTPVFLLVIVFESRTDSIDMTQLDLHQIENNSRLQVAGYVVDLEANQE